MLKENNQGLDTQSLMGDFSAAFRMRELHFHLSLSEIKLRYRGTVIGPFWTSLTMGIFVISIGYILGLMWPGRNVSDYLPYLAAGYMTWLLIVQVLMEGCKGFVDARLWITQASLPYTIFGLAIVVRNIIVYLHHVLIYLILFFVFEVPLNSNVLLAIPGFLIVVLNLIWICTLLSILTARFRDIEPLAQNILQIMLFVTPIIWPVSELPEDKLILVEVNPFYHLIEMVRMPLLGQLPSSLNVTVTCFMAVIGFGILAFLFRIIRHRIVYWL